MRINFYGGPSAGKSTTASDMFARLKRDGVSIESVTEYVKTWAYLKREVAEFDQVYLLGKQMQYETRFLNNGVANVVTDSPIFLSYCYSHIYDSKDLSEHILGIEQVYSKRFPEINIFLNRQGKRFDPNGRYQNEEESRKIDQVILSLLNEHKKEYKVFHYLDTDDIFDYIKERL